MPFTSFEAYKNELYERVDEINGEAAFQAAIQFIDESLNQALGMFEASQEDIETLRNSSKAVLEESDPNAPIWSEWEELAEALHERYPAPAQPRQQDMSQTVASQVFQAMQQSQEQMSQTVASLEQNQQQMSRTIASLQQSQQQMSETIASVGQSQQEMSQTIVSVGQSQQEMLERFMSIMQGQSPHEMSQTVAPHRPPSRDPAARAAQRALEPGRRSTAHPAVNQGGVVQTNTLTEPPSVNASNGALAGQEVQAGTVQQPQTQTDPGTAIEISTEIARLNYERAQKRQQEVQGRPEQQKAAKKQRVLDRLAQQLADANKSLGELQAQRAHTMTGPDTSHRGKAVAALDIEIAKVQSRIRDYEASRDAASAASSSPSSGQSTPRG